MTLWYIYVNESRHEWNEWWQYEMGYVTNEMSYDNTKWVMSHMKCFISPINKSCAVWTPTICQLLQVCARCVMTHTNTYPRDTQRHTEAWDIQILGASWLFHIYVCEWMNHIKRNESCDIWIESRMKWVMSRMNGSCHIWTLLRVCTRCVVTHVNTYPRDTQRHTGAWGIQMHIWGGYGQ